MSRIVAIVGRPNVGKSRLFNRLVRRRISIVHDEAGITRDIVSATVDKDYMLLDTGGLGLDPRSTPDKLIPAVEAQARFAIETANLILFVVDGREQDNPLDDKVAKLLRKCGKPVVIVLNKSDNPEAPAPVNPFKRLGFDKFAHISAEHGHGEDNLRALIAQHLGPVAPVAETVEGERTDKDPLKIAFVGRPNVGKSSLANRLLDQPRLIVSDIAGTTRDSVELDFTFTTEEGKKWPFRLMDTAGIKTNTKLASPVEYFSRLRSIDALQGADIVYLVIDAVDGVTKQDKAIGAEIVKANKPCIVLVNKWDLAQEAFREKPLRGYENERDYREKYAEAAARELFFTPGSPIVFISALKGFAVERMLATARRIDQSLDKKLPTAKLNQVLMRLTETVPPPAVGGRRFRAYYAVQTGNRPYRVKIFCNNSTVMSESYRRYLEGGVIEEFRLAGCPFQFDLIGKEKAPRPDYVPRRADED
ncbi:MAG TPA: ribosome biogenesis GTPase Der [Opitutaceae bacterium]|nr:ribosome biogenesis GTPase Der [Opitutaceae bacterium]